MQDAEELQDACKHFVDGFLFRGEGLSQNECVCKIIARDEPYEDFGIEPAFVVRFGDGHERSALAHQLTPWYATD